MGTFEEDVLRVPKGPQPKEAIAGAPASRSEAARVLQLQRTVGNSGVVQLMQNEDEAGAVQQLVSSGGRPLDDSTREQMEGAFGADFGDVRVHSGPEATASAQRLGAHAYTVGEDIVFSESRYQPDSSAGRETLAHELTHVVQQRSGPVDGTDTGSGVKVSDPGDRFERAAEATAARVAAGQAADAGQVAAAGPGIQRQEADEDEEPVQGMWVQRQEAEEEAPEEMA